MRSLLTFLLVGAVTLVLAAPEPAKTDRPACHTLKCGNKPTAYCSSVLLSTSTVTSGTSTATAFPTDNPCYGTGSQQAAAVDAAVPRPQCFPKHQSPAQLQSACACYGVTPSSTTVTVPAATLVPLLLQSGTTGPYAGSGSDSGSMLEFAFAANNYFTLVDAGDGSNTCNLLYLNNNNQLAYSNSASSGLVLVYDPNGEVPSTASLITCAVEQDTNPATLNCQSPDGYLNVLSNSFNAWHLGFPPQESVFTIDVSIAT
jgi:hypothetical protein